MRNSADHIVFHDDVDGIVSAAIYLHNQVKGGSYRLYPIMSSHRGEKFQATVTQMNLSEEDRLVVLDYEYHDRANVWVDHHFDKRFGDEPVHTEKVHYDPKSKSAARLVHKIPTKVGNYPDSFIKAVEIIDNAGYHNVEQIFTDKSPLMIIRAHLEQAFPSEMMYCRIVEMIAKNHFDIKESVFRLGLGDEVVDSLMERVQIAKKYMTVYGSFSVIDQKRSGQFPRYAEYFIKPDLKYAVRISRIGNKNLYLQVGYNKWCKKQSDINIGEVLRGINYMTKSGGHFSVGGGLLKEDLFERLIEDLDKKFNTEGDKMYKEMEKVGVDKETDPVESKAEEMVKSGEVKTMSEARESVSSSEYQTTPDIGNQHAEEEKADAVRNQE